jgi:hypothetical protein
MQPTRSTTGGPSINSSRPAHPLLLPATEGRGSVPASRSSCQCGSRVRPWGVIRFVNPTGRIRSGSLNRSPWRPKDRRFARVFHPDDIVQKIPALNDVDITVAVDVNCQVGKIVDVLAVEVDVANTSLVHVGASYQNSPERMSSFLSLFTSTNAAVSLNSESII